MIYVARILFRFNSYEPKLFLRPREKRNKMGKDIPDRISILGFALIMTTPLYAAQSADLGSITLFPADNPWHYDISDYPVHPNSDNFIISVGKNTSLHPDFGSTLDGIPWGIPYLLVDKNQTKIAINFTAYGDESDPGPYPIPLNAPIEGGSLSDGDRHILAIDKDAKLLYELYRAFPKADHWDADCGAKFDLSSNALRPETWTSADAAGLPILPGLIRYDEIARGEINHAIRMTVVVSQRKYLWPARHFASSNTNPNTPPMGLRFRLKASVDISKLPPAAKTIAIALKKYGTMVADNGGNWYITGAPDDRMPDDEINALKVLKGSDFEAVLSVDAAGNPIRPGTAIRPKSKLPDQSLVNHFWFDILGRNFSSSTPWQGWKKLGLQ
jgi:hypothetical protein